MQSQISSLPFGDGFTDTTSHSDDSDFAGMNRDWEINSEQALFREYSSTPGHWLSPDPYLGSYDATNPQSFNRYVYALNNPVSLVDPSGLDGDCGQGTASDPCIVYGGGDGGVGPCDFDPITCGYGGNCAVINCSPGTNGNTGDGQQPNTPPAPSNPTQPGKQSKSACNAQRVANAIPGATLTGNNTPHGGHEDFGIQVSGADLAGSGFSFYSSPFGNGNGYRTPFSGAHVNRHPGNILVQYAYGETFAGQAHFDVGNASSGFGGFVEHSLVDVLLGTLLGWIPGLQNFLDPGC